MEDQRPTHRPASIIHTAPDPDKLQVRGYGEVGGILEVRCETPDHPTFKVKFEGGNPSNDVLDETFEGSLYAPVVIPLNKTGNFIYYVLYKNQNGEPPIFFGPYPCNIHICGACR
jgi:hypothetical protein